MDAEGGQVADGRAAKGRGACTGYVAAFDGKHTGHGAADGGGADATANWLAMAIAASISWGGQVSAIASVLVAWRVSEAMLTGGFSSFGAALSALAGLDSEAAFRAFR
jgi:hypothetical protein